MEKEAAEQVSDKVLRASEKWLHALPGGDRRMLSSRDLFERCKLLPKDRLPMCRQSHSSREILA